MENFANYNCNPLTFITYNDEYPQELLDDIMNYFIERNEDR
jgi:hypothetical protein